MSMHFYTIILLHINPLAGTNRNIIETALLYNFTINNEYYNI